MTTSFTRKMAAAGVAVAGAVGLVGINSAQSHAAVPTQTQIPNLYPLQPLNLPQIVGNKLSNKKDGGKALGIAQQVNTNPLVSGVLNKAQTMINGNNQGLSNLVNLFGGS